MSLSTLSAGEGFRKTCNIIFQLNFAGFVVSALFRTHKITDLIGVSAFGIAALHSFYSSKYNNTNDEKRATNRLLTLCTCFWSLRLSLFLFKRVLKLGADKRLHAFYPKANEGWMAGSIPKILKLGCFWSLQAIWCMIVCSPVIIANYDGQKENESVSSLISNVSKFGFLSFIVFSAIEIIADFQKYRFKNDIRNNDRFCNIGLFRYCRHPQYLGEIGIWWSMFIMASPVLKRNQYFTIISPIFSSFLLRFVSGVAMLEKIHRKKYGHMKEYQQWVLNTNLLIPSLTVYKANK